MKNSLKDSLYKLEMDNPVELNKQVLEAEEARKN